MVGEPWGSIDKWHDIIPTFYLWKQIIFHESEWIALSAFWISRPQLQKFFLFEKSDEIYYPAAQSREQITRE